MFDRSTSIEADFDEEKIFNILNILIMMNQYDSHIQTRN